MTLKTFGKLRSPLAFLGAVLAITALVSAIGMVSTSEPAYMPTMPSSGLVRDLDGYSSDAAKKLLHSASVGEYFRVYLKIYPDSPFRAGNSVGGLHIATGKIEGLEDEPLIILSKSAPGENLPKVSALPEKQILLLKANGHDDTSAPGDMTRQSAEYKEFLSKIEAYGIKSVRGKLVFERVADGRPDAAEKSNTRLFFKIFFFLSSGALLLLLIAAVWLYFAGAKQKVPS